MEFNLVNLERELWSGEAQLVIAPGAEGELGIMSGHAPLLTDLVPGPVEVQTTEGDVEIFHISGGILEVSGRRITLLADIAAEASTLDMRETEELLQHAREDAVNEGYQARIKAELAEASGRMRTLQRTVQRRPRRKSRP